ncbi:hypothetical protein ACFRCW_17980 [Streptomyces sp. NPDC056653]|uniref:hypothetical protein n=1 Tax=Streptomyces sp. NPDC056653 TaxID=3345894 RepID=UPI0036A27527
MSDRAQDGQEFVARVAPDGPTGGFFGAAGPLCPGEHGEGVPRSQTGLVSPSSRGCL